MKKILSSLFGGLFLLCSLSAQEPPRNIIGIQAGYVSSWVTSYGVKTSEQSGFMVGVSDELRLTPMLPLYFEAGLNFIAKGYKINGYDDSSTRLNYLQLPVGLTYHKKVGKFVLKPAAGLYYAVGVQGKRTIGNVSSNVFTDGSTSRHDFGYTCGLNALLRKIHVGVSYEQGLLNIDKSDKVYGDDSSMIGYKKIKNRGLIVKVGINF